MSQQSKEGRMTDTPQATPTPRCDAPETFVAIHNGIGRTVVFREDYDALHVRLLAAERDAARFVWYFDWTTKGENFIAAYMQGMREHWTLDQWRAAIDKAMSAALAGSAQEEGR
jgi:hypothetical protein